VSLGPQLLSCLEGLKLSQAANNENSIYALSNLFIVLPSIIKKIGPIIFMFYYIFGSWRNMVIHSTTNHGCNAILCI